LPSEGPLLQKHRLGRGPGSRGQAIEVNEGGVAIFVTNVPPVTDEERGRPDMGLDIQAPVDRARGCLEAIDESRTEGFRCAATPGYRFPTLRVDGL